MTRPKVFCIGFHKTGTTSFHEFVTRLGYRSVHDTRASMELLGLGPNRDGVEGDGHRVDVAARIAPARLAAAVAAYDAFSDNPWPVLFARLDAGRLEHRFVLTVRDTDAWLESQVRFFNGRNTRMRRWIYGYGNPLRHRERYRAVYEAHNAAVRAHFAGRPDFMEVTLGPGTDPDDLGDRVCRFLGHEGPTVAFPASNRTA
ncbi:MAG: sulfotransferase [Candidatus Binatia bacterium]